MSANGFGTLGWAAGVGAAAIGCYLVSLQVASKRGELEQVEREIAHVTRDIRELETEIGTRGRLAQLEQWNEDFLQLSAPRANQFLEGSFHLANMVKPERVKPLEAPMILARAERADDGNAQRERDDGDYLVLASARREEAKAETKSPAKPKVKAAPTPKPVKAQPAKAQPQKSEPVSSDPLAPLPADGEQGAR